MEKFTKNLILVLLAVFIILPISIYSHPAWGIVVDSRKQIYFTDLETVWKIDSQGKLSIFRDRMSGTHVHDLSIDKQDIIYGWYNSYEPQTQKHLRSVWKISPHGEFIEIVSLTENLPSGMSIWRDFDGNMYSVEPWNNERRESKIIKRTSDGKTSLFAGGKFGYLNGKKEKARFGIVIDMAFAEDGSIYLTDSNRVRKIDKFGTVKTLYPTDDSQQSQSQLFGLTVDKQNNVFVADYTNRKLLKIDSSGKISTFLTSENDWVPLGAAASGDDIYVLEGKTYESKSEGNRVLKISSNNQKTVVADLKDANKTNNSQNLIDEKSQPKKDENERLNSQLSLITENQSNQTENKKLGFYGIIGAVIVAFAAFVFFRKNKFIN